MTPLEESVMTLPCDGVTDAKIAQWDNAQGHAVHGLHGMHMRMRVVQSIVCHKLFRSMQATTHVHSLCFQRRSIIACVDMSMTLYLTLFV